MFDLGKLNAWFLHKRNKYRLWWPLIAGFAFLSLVFFVGIAGYMGFENWSFIDSFYMVVITLSTVGYTEVHPLSNQGRLLTSAIIFCGVGGFAYLIGSFTQILVEGRFQMLLEKHRMQKAIDKLKGHFIVCGFGRIGSIVARQIQREGHPVVVVEKDPKIQERLDTENFLYVAGDATSDEVLTSAGLGRAASLITALTQDAHNVYVTLTARQLNPNIHIVSRADTEAHISRLKRAGADRVVMPNIIGGMRMAQTVLRPTVTNLLELAMNGNLNLQMEEVAVGASSTLVGKNLRNADIRPRLNVIIIAIKKSNGEMIFNPGPDTVIEEGSTMVTVGKPEHLAKLRDVGHGSGPVMTEIA